MGLHYISRIAALLLFSITLPLPAMTGEEAEALAGSICAASDWHVTFVTQVFLPLTLPVGQLVRDFLVIHTLPGNPDPSRPRYPEPRVLTRFACLARGDTREFYGTRCREPDKFGVTERELLLIVRYLQELAKDYETLSRRIQDPCDPLRYVYRICCTDRSLASDMLSSCGEEVIVGTAVVGFARAVFVEWEVLSDEQEGDAVVTSSFDGGEAVEINELVARLDLAAQAFELSDALRDVPEHEATCARVIEAMHAPGPLAGGFVAVGEQSVELQPARLALAERRAKARPTAAARGAASRTAEAVVVE